MPWTGNQVDALASQKAVFPPSIEPISFSSAERTKPPIQAIENQCDITRMSFEILKAIR